LTNRSERDEWKSSLSPLVPLLKRIADGPYIASAMGMLGLVLLAASLFLASRFFGRRMGELFRV
jgi:hypothetical protein